MENINNENSIGKKIYELTSNLVSICRSITGQGVRETLGLIQKRIPLKIYEVPSGTQAFDWTVPREWNIKDAYVINPQGKKIVDFKKNSLHVVGYSIPVDKEVTLSELLDHLYSIEDQPEAIPYVTSYYKERWGFCIKHNEKKKLEEGKYRVFIDSEIKDGFLNFGEIVISGKSKKEIFLSTYICHPVMANNESSGPAVMTFLVKWIMSQPREFTYRIVFVPETIGSIVYLSKNYKKMKENIIAGFNITCVGDDRNYSFLPSRKGDTLSDKAALNVLKFKHPNFIHYSFLDRGSDERQYCSPGIDLPVVSIMRSKYCEYPEYHTSLDNLDFISPEGLEGAYDVLRECLDAVENNKYYRIKCLGEPQLGKRNLYPTISTKSSKSQVKAMMDFIAYADGSNNLIDISNIINVSTSNLLPIIESLKGVGLLEIIDDRE